MRNKKIHTLLSMMSVYLLVYDSHATGSRPVTLTLLVRGLDRMSGTNNPYFDAKQCSHPVMDSAKLSVTLNYTKHFKLVTY